MTYNTPEAYKQIIVENPQTIASHNIRYIQSNEKNFDKFGQMAQSPLKS